VDTKSCPLICATLISELRPRSEAEAHWAILTAKV